MRRSLEGSSRRQEVAQGANQGQSTGNAERRGFFSDASGSVSGMAERFLKIVGSEKASEEEKKAYIEDRVNDVLIKDEDPASLLELRSRKTSDKDVKKLDIHRMDIVEGVLLHIKTKVQDLKGRSIPENHAKFDKALVQSEDFAEQALRKNDDGGDEGSRDDSLHNLVMVAKVLHLEDLKMREAELLLEDVLSPPPALEDTQPTESTQGIQEPIHPPQYEGPQENQPSGM